MKIVLLVLIAVCVPASAKGASATSPGVEAQQQPQDLRPVSCGAEKAYRGSGRDFTGFLHSFNRDRCPCGKVLFKTLSDYVLMSNGVAFEPSRHYFLDDSLGAFYAVRSRIKKVDAILAEMSGKDGEEAVKKYNLLLMRAGYPISPRKKRSWFSRSRGYTVDAPVYYREYRAKLIAWDAILGAHRELLRFWPKHKSQFSSGNFWRKPNQKKPIEVERAYTESLLDSYEYCGLPVKLMYDYFVNLSFRKLRSGDIFPPPGSISTASSLPLVTYTDPHWQFLPPPHRSGW